MSDPTIDNIRRSLGRTSQTSLSTRPTIYPPRQAEAPHSEVERSLDEIKKLSGIE